MAKKVFSTKEKNKAIRLMSEGDLTRQQIADKIRCSVAALTLWRRAYLDGQAVEEEWEDETIETEEPAAAVTCQTSCTIDHVRVPVAKKSQDAILELKKQFWSEDFRAANMLLTPTGANPDEVVGLINEALEYAYKYFKK
jgi:transposase-like protein